MVVCLLSLGGEVVDHIPEPNPVCNVPLRLGLGGEKLSNPLNELMEG